MVSLLLAPNLNSAINPRYIFVASVSMGEWSRIPTNRVLRDPISLNVTMKTRF